MSATVLHDERIATAQTTEESFLAALATAHAHRTHVHEHILATRGRAFAGELQALPDLDQLHEDLGVKAVADLRAQGAPGEPREAIVDLAEIPEEPAIRGSMQSARARNVAGTEGNAVHGRLARGQGCPFGAGAPGSKYAHWATARYGQCVH